MGMSSAVRLTCVCVSLSLALPLWAAGTSPNVSGRWAGSASGHVYHEKQGENDTYPLLGPARADLTATLTQTAHDIIVDLQVLPDGEAPFNATIVGKAGDFAFWARGTFTESDGKPAEMFVCGRYPVKGNKVTGTMVMISDNEIVYVTFKMSKTAGLAVKRAAQALPAVTVKAPESTDPPFDIIGKASGLTYTYASNAKAGKYTASVIGNMVPATNTATLTLTTAAGAQVFQVSYMDTEYGLIMGGQSGSDNIVVFLKLSGTSGSGLAWIYDDTRLIEAKITAKAQ